MKLKIESEISAHNKAFRLYQNINETFERRLEIKQIFEEQDLNLFKVCMFACLHAFKCF